MEEYGLAVLFQLPRQVPRYPCLSANHVRYVEKVDIRRVVVWCAEAVTGARNSRQHNLLSAKTTLVSGIYLSAF